MTDVAICSECGRPFAPSSWTDDLCSTECVAKAKARPLTYHSLTPVWRDEPRGRFAKENEPEAPGLVAPRVEDVRLPPEPLIEGDSNVLGVDLSGKGGAKLTA
jgi:hypothetical protein